MQPLRVKVLSYRSTQQYAVRRTVQSALALVRGEYPDASVAVEEVKDIQSILKYTQVFVMPSLVIEEKLVCVGLFPAREEVAAWMKTAIQNREEEG